MNQQKIATACNTLALGFAELAEALNESSVPVRADGPAAAAPPAVPASFSDGTPVDEPEQWEEFARASSHPSGQTSAEPQGFDAICPKHRVPYAEGRYGPYCKSLTDDEAWGKRKPDGKVFCSITPKNAATYLRNLAAVA